MRLHDQSSRQRTAIHHRQRHAIASHEIVPVIQRPQVLPYSQFLALRGISVELNEIRSRQEPVLILIMLFERLVDLVIILAAGITCAPCDEPCALLLVHLPVLRVLPENLLEHNTALGSQLRIVLRQ